VAYQDAGLSVGYGTINHGGNSGYQAINLAYMLGAARIVLLGFDMQATGGKTHWHGDHPAGLGNPSDFSGMIKAFDALAEDLKMMGVKVINSTTTTALRCFERMPLDLAYDH
jgi:acetyl-CoA acetyltransferase